MCPGDEVGNENTYGIHCASEPSGRITQEISVLLPEFPPARLEFELERLRSEGRINLRTASDLLQDDIAQRAPRIVASILGLARRAGPLPREAVEVASLLERWDGEMGAKSAGAAAYHLVINHLIVKLLRVHFGAELFQRYLDAPHVRPQYAIERLVLRALTSA